MVFTEMSMTSARLITGLTTPPVNETMASAEVSLLMIRAWPWSMVR